MHIVGNAFSCCGAWTIHGFGGLNEASLIRAIRDANGAMLSCILTEGQAFSIQPISRINYTSWYDLLIKHGFVIQNTFHNKGRGNTLLHFVYQPQQELNLDIEKRRNYYKNSYRNRLLSQEESSILTDYHKKIDKLLHKNKLNLPTHIRYSSSLKAFCEKISKYLADTLPEHKDDFPYVDFTEKVDKLLSNV